MNEGKLKNLETFQLEWYHSWGSYTATVEGNISPWNMSKRETLSVRKALNRGGRRRKNQLHALRITT